MPRKYEQRARARHRDETRRRITDAAVDLHRTIGPARTSVTDVARRAGVHRTTVYEHFADDGALFEACGARWDELHPPPDVGSWARIAEPADRLRTALGELYAYYDDAGEMLDRVLADGRSVPVLTVYLEEQWLPFLGWVVDVLATGWGVRGGAARKLRALLRVAVEFSTWKALTGPGGLSSAAAAETAAAAVVGWLD